MPFQAGKLAHFIAKWREITSDSWVLDAVQHYHIEFKSVPFQTSIPREIKFSSQEEAIISEEIAKMLKTGAILEKTHAKGEFISNIFIRPKKDGSFRLIINLKGLNTFVAYFNF